MKRLYLIMLLLSGLGCSVATAPEAPKPLYRPEHDNITATFTGHPEGPLVWLCATQPRSYQTGPHGLVMYEEDHYLQYVPCPATPIK